MNTLVSFMTFEEWLPSYVEFRKKCATILSKTLSSEPSELDYESRTLEPLRWEAERMRAKALSHYYAAKIAHVETMRAEGWAMSAVSEVAKAKCHKELWAKEDAEGLNEVIKSRQIKISVLTPRREWKP